MKNYFKVLFLLTMFIGMFSACNSDENLEKNNNQITGFKTNSSNNKTTSESLNSVVFSDMISSDKDYNSLIKDIVVNVNFEEKIIQFSKNNETGFITYKLELDETGIYRTVSDMENMNNYKLPKWVVDLCV